MMEAWTTKQDSIIRELSYLGAEAVRKERDKMRQRNSRLARKHGLKTRRERGGGGRAC